MKNVENVKRLENKLQKTKSKKNEARNLRDKAEWTSASCLMIIKNSKEPRNHSHQYVARFLIMIKQLTEY